MSGQKRYVSLEEANATLPHVRPILRRLMQLHGLLRSSAEKLAELGVPVSAPLIASGEMFGCVDVDRMLVRARGLSCASRDDVVLLEHLAASVRDVEEGWVDFVSLRDGCEEVRLCWRVGEPCITSYYDPARDPAPSPTALRSVDGHAFLDGPCAAR